MTDKELLELAAKAARYPVVDHPNRKSIKNCYFVLNRDNWNPLINDGDALRLAIDLNMSVDLMNYCNFVEVTICSNSGSILTFIEQRNNDKHAATRRAIVRAAAAIGAKL